MNINEIIAFNTQIIFILLSGIAIVDYIRHRDARRRDFALMATALGLPFGITLLRKSNLFFNRARLTLRQRSCCSRSLTFCSASFNISAPAGHELA